MARTTVRLFVAAMLALLTAMIPADAVAELGGACQNSSVQSQTKQTMPCDPRRNGPDARPRREASAYISFLLAEPDIAVMFQLPPPAIA
jgi:hypothetical protein